MKNSRERLFTKERDEVFDPGTFATTVRDAVSEIYRHQVEAGLKLLVVVMV